MQKLSYTCTYKIVVYTSTMFCMGTSIWGKSRDCLTVISYGITGYMSFNDTYSLYDNHDKRGVWLCYIWSVTPGPVVNIIRSLDSLLDHFWDVMSPQSSSECGVVDLRAVRSKSLTFIIELVIDEQRRCEN